MLGALVTSIDSERSSPTVCRRLGALVQDAGQHAGPAAQVDHASAGHGDNQVKQVVERLLPLGAEARVLVGLPAVGSLRSHDCEPSNPIALA